MSIDVFHSELKSALHNDPLFADLEVLSQPATGDALRSTPAATWQSWY